MPYVLVQTNISVPEVKQKELMVELSQQVASMLNKSEGYMQVAIQPDMAMIFAKTEEPTAFLMVKSLRLPQEQTPEFSSSLCQLLETSLGIPKERIYIEFTDGQPHLWGWNGKTF